MKKAGLNNTSLKQQNRGMILKLIATGECTSRIELARKIGLSKVAASKIVNEFLEEGIMEEREKVRVQGKGRNPVQICISEKAPKMLGVHIYREECNVILCDLQLHILKKITIGLHEKNIGQLLSKICEAIDEILEMSEDERIYGIGIGAIAPVDNNQGMILDPPNFYGIRDLPIQEEIQKRYHMPVFFDGESNCAALAEKYYGSGKDCEDFIYVDIANGIGSGVILNGEIYSNTSGLVCELGHTSIDWQGNSCNCGNRGCLETYASSNVIEKRLQEVTGEDKSFIEFCWTMEQILDEKNKTGKALSESAAKMDGIFRDMTEKLACGFTNFVNGLNPQKIIIGHEGYWIPHAYIESLEKKVNERQIARDYQTIQIVKSHFRTEATVYGCACSLLTAVFEGKLFQ